MEDVDPTVYFSFIVLGVFLNGIGLLGLVGNVISAIVLSRPQMKSSINCLLIGLSTFDSILIITSILMFGLPAIHEFDKDVLRIYVRQVLARILPLIYPIGMIAQTGSVYLTLCVTVERYVAVCLPLKARAICTYRRACMYVAGITVLSALYNVPRFCEVSYVTEVDPFTNETVSYPEQTALRADEKYINVYITWLYLLVMYIVPFTCMAVFNLMIYMEVKRTSKERSRMTRRQQKEIGLATMLMVVVLVFFVCNICALISNILEVMQINYASLNSFSNLLVTVNSSVNFVIYCIFGEKFKRLFCHLFCRPNCKSKGTSEFTQRSLRYHASGQSYKYETNGKRKASQQISFEERGVPDGAIEHVVLSAKDLGHFRKAGKKKSSVTIKVPQPICESELQSPFISNDAKQRRLVGSSTFECPRELSTQPLIHGQVHGTSIEEEPNEMISAKPSLGSKRVFDEECDVATPKSTSSKAEPADFGGEKRFSDLSFSSERDRSSCQKPHVKTVK